MNTVRKKVKRGILSVLVAVGLIVGMLPTTAFAAVGTDKMVQLGVSGITKGSKIYYGTWNSAPIEWRVLDTNGNGDTYKDANGNAYTGGSMFLLSEKLLDWITFSSSGQQICDWAGSNAQAWCKDFSGESGTNVPDAFTNAEFNAILQTTRQDKWDTGDKLTGERVFFLSKTEATSEKYSMSYMGRRMAYMGENPASWWTRVWTTVWGTNYMQIIASNGAEADGKASDTNATRPCFNLNTDSVLFISAAQGGKPEAFDVVGKYNYGNYEWKLTLLDSSRSGFTAGIRKEDTKTYVSYSGATTGESEYISALIKDSSGTVTYYGRLEKATDASGEIEIDLSGKMNDGDTLYIFNEQYNGDYKTDYASELIAMTKEISSVEVAIDAPEGGKDLDTAAECTTVGVSSTAPAVTWTPGDVPAGWGKSYTASVTLTAADGYAFADSTTATVNGETATAAKDAEGNLTVTYAFAATAQAKLKNIATPASVTAANGTAKTADALRLPSTVTIETEDTSVTTANVDWDLGSTTYDPANKEEQNFEVSGTVTLPAGIVNTDNVPLTVTIEVTVSAAATEKDKLVSITTPATITVANGTAADEIINKLPATVGIETANKTVTSATVTWDTAKLQSYDSTITTEQTITLTGDVTCPDTVDANGVTLTATITIIVSAEGATPVTPTPAPVTPTPAPVTPTPAPATPAPATPAPASYYIMDGANSNWVRNEDGSMAIRGNGEFSKFTGVKVDGVLIDPANYIVTEGSTIVTLKPEYLNTLSEGSHSFEILWADGSAATDFTVTGNAADYIAVSAPQTGYDSHTTLWTLLLLAALSGLAASVCKKRKMNQ